MQFIKQLTFALLIIIATLAAAFFGFYLSIQPPREAKVIKNFEEHRVIYEELQRMLLEDKGLVRVADWGVQTSDSPNSQRPPEGRFPLARYRRYLPLLEQIGAKGAFPTEGDHPMVGVQVWVSGFLEKRHVNICWRDEEPKNQVASVDEFYRTAKPRKPAYRHIEGNWYIWVDW
jgi:hypothetical protein